MPASRLANLQLGLLHNPRSGANLAASAALRRWVEARPGLVFRIASEPASIAQALREMAQLGVNTVAVSGGDGTVNAVLNTLFSHSPFPQRPLLALLCGGTANMTARDVGLRGRQDRALQSLVECAARGGEGLEVVARPVMRIDPGAGREPIHGMFFGAAAIAQGIEYHLREVHARGLRGDIGRAVTLGRFILAMARGERAIVEPVPLTLAIDDGPAATFDCQVLYVSTLERLVLGLRPFWGDEAAPLRYTSVRAAPAHWLKALPALLRGRPNSCLTPENGYESRNAKRLRLVIDEHFFVDGELFSSTPGTPLILESAGPASFIRLR